MPVIGCFLLMILPLVGLTAGLVVAGPTGAKWGVGIGFAIALVFVGIAAAMLVKTRRR